MFSKIASGIEKLNLNQGKLTSMLIFPLLLVVLYEVFMRYGFNSPTVWGFEATAFLYGMHYMFGLSYTDVTKGHVQVDIFTSLAPKKTRAAISALTTLVFFLPVMVCMTIWTTKFAIYSVEGLERNSTSWAPAIWPFKIVMALCFFILLLQGIANLIRDLQTVFGKEEN
ncbi:MAG: TRAP transporter small permease subunit [Desulfocapsaceae bacterium]|nr:TRAP transporter small permease subunit [Desulfocapsaceae bacterium]